MGAIRSSSATAFACARLNRSPPDTSADPRRSPRMDPDLAGPGCGRSRISRSHKPDHYNPAGELGTRVRAVRALLATLATALLGLPLLLVGPGILVARAD